MKPDIIAVCGPTGIGKTSAAIGLSEIFNGEIIGADSMQIYKLMDIGTAKPTHDERKRVRHHLVDFLSPDEDFDAGVFSGMAKEIIEELTSRNVLPVVAGGTGLYVKSMMYGLFRDRPANQDVIDRLTKEAEEKGAEHLHGRLAACDPEAAARIHPNDLFRVIRALEVFESTGKNITSYHAMHGFPEARYNALKIGLHMDRQKLYERIELRVDMMIDEGLLDEVRGLLDMGFSPDLKSMQSIGYKHMVDHLLKGVSWDESVRTLKRDTRRYAKRQLTWFRKDAEIHWHDSNDLEGMAERVRLFLGR